MTRTANQDLRSLAIAIGETVDAAGNRPVDLNERDFAWFVEQGALDVFIIEHENGVPISTAKHILRADEGQLVFGVGDTGSSLTTFAKGLPNTKLDACRRTSFGNTQRVKNSPIRLMVG